MFYWSSQPVSDRFIHSVLILMCSYSFLCHLSLSLSYTFTNRVRTFSLPSSLSLSLSLATSCSFLQSLPLTLTRFTVLCVLYTYIPFLFSLTPHVQTDTRSYTPTMLTRSVNDFFKLMKRLMMIGKV